MDALPCSWDVSCQACAGFEDAEDWQRDAALWLASTYLWAATGRQFGTCPITVQSSQQRGTPIAYQAYPEWAGQDGVTGGPFLFSGRWFNAGCATACCGAGSCGVVLRGPVAAIDEVWIGGEALPSSAYRVDVAGGAWLLVRTDGECWPSCNDGSFEVTYDIGRPLPEALKLATALLACEYLKALKQDGACRLPARMTSLARQGVEIEVAPPEPAQGMTGIREVDDIVQALNPGRRQGPPLILSPDMPESCDRVTVIGAGS